MRTVASNAAAAHVDAHVLSVLLVQINWLAKRWAWLAAGMGAMQCFPAGVADIAQRAIANPDAILYDNHSHSQ